VVCLLLALLTWLLVNGREPRSMRIRFSGRRLRSSPSRARTIPLGHSPHHNEPIGGQKPNAKSRKKKRHDLHLSRSAKTFALARLRLPMRGPIGFVARVHRRDSDCGAVITEAALGAGDVMALVHITAFGLDEGGSPHALSKQVPCATRRGHERIARVDRQGAWRPRSLARGDID
jgi:hypothetical protein